MRLSRCDAPTGPNQVPAIKSAVGARISSLRDNGLGPLDHVTGIRSRPLN
jgi:hypothetical protein